MLTFAAGLKDAQLLNWLQWWDKRKRHWASAFRPTNNAPSNNLSECVHSAEKARGSVNVSLIDAVHDDVAAAYTLKQKIKGYISGTYTGGNGRSLINLADISNSKQQHRSIHLSKSLNKSEDSPFIVEPDATHREDTICDVSTGVVSPKVITDTSVTPTENAPVPTYKPTEYRPTKRRNSPSQLFLKIRDNALRDYRNYNITTDTSHDCTVNNEQRFIVFNRQFHETNDYIVKIGTQPECACMFFVKNQSKQICKHIIMVLLELGVEENDPLLYQTSYTATELHLLLSRNLQRLTEKKNVQNPLHMKLKHRLYLSRYEKGSRRGRRPQCSTCKLPLADGLVVEMCGKYRYKQNTFDHTFRFHVNDKCLSKPPWHSDISVMPQCIGISEASSADAREARLHTTLNFVWYVLATSKYGNDPKQLRLECINKIVFVNTKGLT